MNLEFGSVCSGIEAASVALHPLGWKAAWLSEIAAFPASLLAHHYPDVPNLGDMTKIARAILTGEAAAPDALIGGTPCQAFSVAGLREGLADERGQLTLAYVRIFDAIDYIRRRAGKRPAICWWENVPGVLSSKDNAFGCFLAGLAGEDRELQSPGAKWPNAGVVVGPARTVAWRVLDAQYFGVAQRRRRVFVIASARKDFDPVKVLFEFDGMRRDTAPSREPQTHVAALTANGVGTCGADDNQAQAGHLIASTGDVSHCLNAGGMGRQDFETETLVAQPRAIAFDARQHPVSSEHVFGALGSSHPQAQAVCITGDITHTLKAEGFDASEDGTGRSQPIVASVALRGREGGATAELGGDVAGCLRASGGGGDKPHALIDMAVRRLTPRECERLQGFPDDYTAVPWNGWRAMDESETPESCRAEGLEIRQNAKTGKWRVKDVDGPRYKALGNSMAVPVMNWIGRRIEMVEATA
ncbi:DNA cytosine methyltransferase [Paraburkholderia tropica]|uniref:DNA cytosine methyltransferase n=1 Tax=Paraburkholderia tropica TaxID=92647 RepID=UPI002AB75CFB|nr:DNA cytosine methyltransferase [Paraburkholderia tropica]